MTNGADTPTHLDLLVDVRALQAAAVTADHVGVRVAVRHLRDELQVHVADEQQGQGALSASLAQALASGQQRLLSLVASLEEEGCDESVTPCTVRIAEFAAQLRRQAGWEQRIAGLTGESPARRGCSEGEGGVMGGE